MATKTATPIRSLYEMPEFIEVANREAELRQEYDALLVRIDELNTLVFPDTVGHFLRRGSSNHRGFKRVLKLAGLSESIRFHDLRHSHATMLLVAGVHPRVCQERLGHSQIAVTLGIYSHVLPSMQADAAEKVQGLLSGFANGRRLAVKPEIPPQSQARETA